MRHTTSRTIRFLTSILVALSLSLNGCGGGGSGGGNSATGPGDIIGTGIRGTAATGKALANVTIETKSQSGAVKTGMSDAAGKFQINGLDNGPFLLRANTSKGFLYSVAYKNGAALIQSNIHPYTDLIVRNWFRTQGQDVDAVFNNAGGITGMPTPAQIDAIKTEIAGIVARVLETHGVAGFDLLAGDFAADGTGFDAFLDNDPVVINNNQITVIINNPVTNIQNIIIDNLSLTTDFTSASDTPPTTPANPRALAAGTDEILVVWDASSDDKGVSGYNVYRNGQLVGTTPYPVFSDKPLAANTDYSYEIEAIDGRGQVSAKTSPTPPLQVNTPDTTAPPAASGLQAQAAGNSITLNWTQSQIDDVAAFRILRGAAGNANTLVATVTSTRHLDINLATGTEFCYRVEAVDAAGNKAPASSEVCATTAGGSGNMPTSLAFSQPSYTVSESAGSISITVNRSGDLSQAASVDYQAANGTATDGQDFTATSGTLNWAASDATPKTFTVQILTDSLNEGNETVQLSLSNPVNATLGQATATLTINDAVAVTCTQANSIVLSNGDINTDTVLDQPCYQIPNGLRVNNPAKLTIQPGVQLQFAAGQELRVNTGASLNAVGTAGAPIVIGSADPTPGFWKGVIFEQSNSTLNRLESVIVENAETDVEVSGFSFAKARLALKNTTLRNASLRGLFINEHNSPSSANSVTLPVFDNVTLTGNGLPVALPDNKVHILGTDSHYSGNTDDRIYVISQGIAMDQTWNKLDVPYFLSSQGSTYNVDAALVLQPGVQLMFNSGTKLLVNSAGSLNATGTAAERILFTGQNPSPGYWQGVEFSMSNIVSNQLDYVTIEYAEDNLTVTGFSFSGGQAKLSLKNTILQNANNRGFFFNDSNGGAAAISIAAFQNVRTTANDKPGALPDFLVGVLGADSQFSGNTDDRLYVFKSDINSDQTWKKLDVPYFISSKDGFYFVKASLTIEPGTQLIFNSGVRFQIEPGGVLNATGTAGNPIVFTGQQPSPAYWTGIYFRQTNNPGNQLDHVVVEYAGAGTQATSGNIIMECFSFASATLTVSNSTIKDSGAWGIYRNNDSANGCNLSASGNSYSNNALGNINQ